ncbi:hypothetical protein WA026_016263 [Henosepilachna vigintioctopunctata]|uniref:Uncharacterized protein n=1 Tax=Henosepilachna vigintioctopunctata TaxID=420089 RepID=A0AAW1UMZ9_9CUCU
MICLYIVTKRKLIVRSRKAPFPLQQNSLRRVAAHVPGTSCRMETVWHTSRHKCPGQKCRSRLRDKTCARDLCPDNGNGLRVVPGTCACADHCLHPSDSKI